MAIEGGEKREMWTTEKAEQVKKGKHTPKHIKIAHYKYKNEYKNSTHITYQI
jgi:hypothetical protein